MRDFVDGSAFNFEQGQRARKLFAAVVLAALDDAIAALGRVPAAPTDSVDTSMQTDAYDPGSIDPFDDEDEPAQAQPGQAPFVQHLAVAAVQRAAWAHMHQVPAPARAGYGKRPAARLRGIL